MGKWIEMSSSNIRKHISMKHGLPLIERRDETEESKGDEADAKFSVTSEQNEVIKRIQNKLKMKKRNSNPQNERQSGTPPDLGTTGSLSNK